MNDGRMRGKKCSVLITFNESSDFSFLLVVAQKHANASY